MKIKTAYLKNKKYLLKCQEVRQLFPELFANIKIESGKINPNKSNLLRMR